MKFISSVIYAQVTTDITIDLTKQRIRNYSDMKIEGCNLIFCSSFFFHVVFFFSKFCQVFSSLTETL